MVKIYKGIPYTGTLPAVLTGTKAGYLHKYKIYGNLSQNGTPTPSDPIYPSECGERTGNLFDLNATDTNNGYDSTGRYLTNTGATGGNAGGTWRISEYITIEPNSEYILSGFTTGVNPSYCLYDDNKDFISGARYASESVLTITTPSNARYLRFSRNINTDDVTMLTEGTIAPTEYIPYGYKLPLLSGSTPVDIYIGESQTTRRIKKLVLTGAESWGKSSSRTGSFYLVIGTNAITTLGLCDRAINVGTIGQYDSIGKMFVEPNGLQRILNVWLFDTNLSLDEFKTYLTQQYANGTPVTVWYVLATPTTGTLNEPLRKIGDYADTIDSTQTTAQIPTSANSTTISWAGQGLAPSEFDSIQEWVDIPTYKRVNGAWVADN